MSRRGKGAGKDERPAAQTEGLSSEETRRFASLARRLIAVPRKELDQEIHKYEERKPKAAPGEVSEKTPAKRSK